MRKHLLLLLTVISLWANHASAQDHQMDITFGFDVSAGCRVIQNAPPIQLTMSSAPFTHQTERQFIIQCNDGMPLTIEANTGQGGATILNGWEGGTLPAYISQGSATSGVPWGTAANGEAWQGVATGYEQALTVGVSINIDPATGLEGPEPTPQYYPGGVIFTVLF